MPLDVNGIYDAQHVPSKGSWCLNDLPDLVDNFGALSDKEKRKALKTVSLERGRDRFELFLSRNEDEIPYMVRSSVKELLEGIQNEIDSRAEAEAEAEEA